MWGMCSTHYESGPILRLLNLRLFTNQPKAVYKFLLNKPFILKYAFECYVVPDFIKFTLLVRDLFNENEDSSSLFHFF